MGESISTPITVPTVWIGGMRISRLDRAQTADLMIAAALLRRREPLLPAFFTSANGEILSRVARDRRLARIFAHADLVSADGQPMVVASRWLTRMPLPERVATTDLFHDVAERALRSDISFYLLGASAQENAKAVASVRDRYPGLHIAGARNGYFEPWEEGYIASEIAGLRPDVLWIALGAPREQEFVLRNRTRLRGVGAIKTSGGLFNFLSGTRSRAPEIMQRAGFEWLYRLSLEPRRLFGRYAVTNIHASFLLLVGTGSDPTSPA
jgi:N-acetylglucosaminyldiphosphoundecaprenol N-acetyl-beta-D-mannosaminyltransferase